MTQNWFVWPAALLLLASALPVRLSADVAVLWTETFEQDDFWSRWHSDGGIWAVGTPSLGPQSAYAGSRCAGTLLDNNYLPNTDSRLIRDRIFVVPAASLNPRLRLWHWFQGGPGASRAVEIDTGTGEWQPLTAISGWTNADWTRATFDLRPFSGQAVQLAFHFQSNPDLNTGPGWFIDQVTVESGDAPAPLVNTTETFESGFGPWSTNAPGWRWGPPRAAAGGRDGSTNDVGTITSSTSIDARLISPVFEVPPAPQNPQLRFWHWFNMIAVDLAEVEIAVNGRRFQALSQPYGVSSGVWTRPSLDLRPYAGQDVQIAFHFKSAAGVQEGYGWDVDDIVVQTNLLAWDPVTQPEDFNAGLGNWSVDNGVWQAAPPPSDPGRASSAVVSAGTALASVYTGADSRLISPRFTVPQTTSKPLLNFDHWYDLPARAQGIVELRVDGADWQTLVPTVTGASGAWVTSQADLSAYVGTSVQIAFHIQAPPQPASASGWYVDQVQVVLDPVTTGPRLVISRIDSGTVQLCPDSLQAGITYILESCDGLSGFADPNHWTQIGLFEDDSCQPFNSSASSARFYRVRTGQVP